MFFLKISMLFNAVYAVTTFGIPIFEVIFGIIEEGSFVTARNTLDFIAIVDPVSQIFAMLIVPFFKRKILLLISFFTVGLLNIIIGIMDGVNVNIGVFFVALIIILVTSAI